MARKKKEPWGKILTVGAGIASVVRIASQADTITSLTAERNSLKPQNSTLWGENLGKSLEIFSLKEQVTSLTGQLGARTTELQGARHELGRSETERARLGRENDGLQQRVTDLETEVTRLRQQLEAQTRPESPPTA